MIFFCARCAFWTVTVEELSYYYIHLTHAPLHCGRSAVRTHDEDKLNEETHQHPHDFDSPDPNRSRGYGKAKR